MDKNAHTLIAVPTNDEVNIFPKMLGMADKMFIYELNEGHMKLVEKRNNPYAKTQQHLKTLDVYDLLHDCEGGQIFNLDKSLTSLTVKGLGLCLSLEAFNQ